MHGTDPTAKTMPGFVGSRLDRVDPIRTNPARLAETFADPAARLLVLDGLDPVEVDGHLLLEPLASDARVEDHVLLGVDPAARPIFTRLVADLGPALTPTPRSRAIVGLVPADEVALYGAARSLVHWHARHRHCSVCGATTRPAKAGWSRQCEADACAAEHFPRTDPVVIMLAEHRGRILLGRQHAWPPGRYSALAGFVEPGETIEEAVARELFEESGIRVHDVRYVMSQPWPFPSSLMIACIGQAQDDALTLDETEIEDAFWCDADQVRAALAGDPDAPFIAPPQMAVAWHLLDHWLAAVAPLSASA
ncbi:NADH pyrophosphatase [Sphingobium sp. Leaf26]|uniref:NAD(+) diphosphatase n=1 Tax=Sphingobium sp. Leaf26 TaxID=1735693 RepID=UPI0006F7E08E|nr:NAD(+) diphosphatase [Sphingobium sp. Leaf26]KQN07075.1 NADH pyrophosphatase [Sphingobium sp. Leaf26]